LGQRLVAGVPLQVGSRWHPPVFGVEHEYRVLDGAAQLDFARFVHELGFDGLRLDPTDPNAYRMPSGGLITADGREAEIATAPVPLRPGCTEEIEWRTGVARHTLQSALPARVRLDGYSTHLNVEIDDGDVVAAGHLFTRHFAPAMMLLLDRRASPGLLVRPRCGRLELGGEYCEGDQLRTAAVFAAAGALTCASAVRDRDARQHLPPRVRARVRPANIRAGWYVDRRAFGADLYEHGRATPLRVDGRPRWRAQDHLTDAWMVARPAAEGLFAPSELALVDDAITGVRPLPLEHEPDRSGRAGSYAEPAFGRAVHRRVRPRFSVEPLSIAWEAVAFRVRGSREAVACVPRALLDSFFDELDAGRLDARIEAFLASPSQGRVLRASDQTSTAGLFDEMGSPAAIAPSERVVRRGLGGHGGGTPRDARRNKHRRSGGRRSLLLVSAAIVAIAACVASAYAVTQRDGDHVDASAPAVGERFDAVFTVASVNVGPHYRGEPVPSVGDQERVRVIVDCTDTTCSFGNERGANAGPFVDLGLPFAQTAPGVYTATGDSSETAAACGNIAIHQLASVEVHRASSAGPITGLNGRYEVTHPGGVEFTAPPGVCSTFDIAYTFVGTPATR